MVPRADRAGHLTHAAAGVAGLTLAGGAWWRGDEAGAAEHRTVSLVACPRAFNSLPPA